MSPLFTTSPGDYIAIVRIAHCLDVDSRSMHHRWVNIAFADIDTILILIFVIQNIHLLIYFIIASKGVCTISATTMSATRKDHIGHNE